MFGSLYNTLPCCNAAAELTEVMGKDGKMKKVRRKVQVNADGSPAPKLVISPAEYSFSAGMYTPCSYVSAFALDDCSLAGCCAVSTTAGAKLAVQVKEQHAAIIGCALILFSCKGIHQIIFDFRLVVNSKQCCIAKAGLLHPVLHKTIMHGTCLQHFNKLQSLNEM